MSEGEPPKRRKATAVSPSSLDEPRDPERQRLAERWEGRLAVPVLVAALVSVPAVFLMTTGGTTAAVGRVVNWISVAVLVGESILLILLSRDITDWVRAHKWELLLVGVTVPAVVFAIGPVQVLRVILSVGTLRILRARRILRAGRLLAHKLNLRARRRKLLIAGAGVLAAVFLGIVLANPESRTRRVLAWSAEHIGVPATVLACLLVAAAIVLALRWFTTTRLARVLPGTRPRPR